MFLTKPKHTSHEQRILNHLKKSGGHGAWSYELSKQSVGSWDWRKYISNLRKDGHNIVSVRVKGQTFKYYLVPDPLET